MLFSKSLFVFVISQGGFSLLACCCDIQSCCSDIWQQSSKEKVKEIIKQILFKTFGALLHWKHYIWSLTMQGNKTVALIVMISVISQAVFSMDMFCHVIPSCNHPSCMLLWYTKPGWLLSWHLQLFSTGLLVVMISQAVLSLAAIWHYMKIFAGFGNFILICLHPCCLWSKHLKLLFLLLAAFFLWYTRHFF